MVKILYLITRADCGGAQIHVRDLLANLPQECEPVLAAGGPGFLCEEASKLGVPVRIVPDMVQPIHPLKDVKALAALVRLMRDERPDIVHAHTSKAGLLARLAARLTGTAAVFTAHTWSFADGIPRVQRWVSMPLEMLAGALGAEVIAVSQANVDLAVRKKIIRKESLFRIWNGIADTPLRARPGSKQTTTLVMSARFCAQKDHLLLLEALAGVEEPWRLVFAGDGPTRPEVERSARELDLTERVSFLGNRDDIPTLLADADVFVLATKWEGLPLSILEAMRAGLPVIATNVGGVAEAITDGVTGFVTEPGNVDQMRNRIQTLIRSKELLISMGSQARRRYEQDFKLEVMMRKTLRVYQKVLAYGGESLLTEPADSLEI